MSVTPAPLGVAPYAATVHSVELGDFGHSFRPIAPDLFTCPIKIRAHDLLDEAGELRAALRAARTQ